MHYTKRRINLGKSRNPMASTIESVSHLDIGLHSSYTD